MSMQTWGDLLKAQDDSETIEQAIARIVQEHDDDEASHLETGQSLESHKAAEIIDHLARSVYRDKLAFDRFQIDEHFSTIDAWGKSAGVTLEAIGEMMLATTNVTNNTQQAYIIPGDASTEAGKAANSPIWESRVKLDQSTAQHVYIGQMDTGVPSGFGFYIHDATLYACYFDGDSVQQNTQITGIDVTEWHRYRCEFSAGNYLKWYVDGILKQTLSAGLPTGFQMYAWYEIKTTTTAYKYMYVQSLHYDEDYTA